MEKLMKTAKGLDTVCRILFIAAVICLIACAVCLPVLFLVNPEAFRTALSDGQITINGGITFTLPESASAAVNFRPVLAAAMASGLVVCAVMAYALKQIHGILAPMKEGAPFSASVGTRFSRLGWFTVIAGIALNIFNAIGKTLLVKILVPMLDGVTQVSVQHLFSLNFIIIAFLLFLLSYVFRYGAELQRLSDETL